MRLKKTIAIVLVVTTIFAIAACSAGGSVSVDTATVTVPDASDTSTEEKEPTWLTLSQNSMTNYKIVKSAKTDEFSEEIDAFAKEFSALLGAAVDVIEDDSAETEYEILVGRVDRPESRALYADAPYTGASARVYGNKIVVAGYDAEMLSKALRRVKISVTSKENDMKCISGEFDYTVNTAGVNIPIVESNGEFLGLYYCTNNQYEVGYKGATDAEYYSYCQNVVDDGYSVYLDNISGTNRFTTYIKDDVQLHTSWYPSTGTLKVVFGKDETLPPNTSGSTSGTVVPYITQLARAGADQSYPNGAPGLSYVIGLPDGRFIIIDGGPQNNSDEKALLDYLKANNKNGGKPVIAAWFISHADGDHIELPISFLNTYGNEVTVEMALYSFPDFSKNEVTVSSDHTNMYKRVTNFQKAVSKNNSNARLVNFHTGQKFMIGAANIEIIYTHEDYYPASIPYGNQTSSAFTVTLGGKKIMFLGDCEVELCRFMVATYGSALKSDILQVSHHGFNGATLELYQAIDPEICLWAVEEKRFNNDARCLGTANGYEFNKWLRNNSIKLREHYHCSVTTKIELKG